MYYHATGRQNSIRHDAYWFTTRQTNTYGFFILNADIFSRHFGDDAIPRQFIRHGRHASFFMML